MGIVLGLYAGLSPGPLMALTITETLQRDTLSGLKVAVAPVATDPPIILLTVFVLSRFSGFHSVLGGVSLAGGFFLLYLAYGSLRTRDLELDVPREGPGPFTRAFLVNVLNPHPYLFWFSVGAPVILRAGRQHPAAPLAFVLSFYLLLVGSKMVLVVLVGRFKTFLSSRVYRLVMRFLGMMLVVLALLLFREGLKLLRIV